MAAIDGSQVIAPLPAQGLRGPMADVPRVVTSSSELENVIERGMILSRGQGPFFARGNALIPLDIPLYVGKAMRDLGSPAA